jgi:hypothetical protein
MMVSSCYGVNNHCQSGFSPKAYPLVPVFVIHWKKLIETRILTGKRTILAAEVDISDTLVSSH